VPCVGKYTVCKDEPWFLFGTCLLWGTDLVCSESDLSVLTNEHENWKTVEEWSLSGVSRNENERKDLHVRVWDQVK
jgi:hypothetical protein